MKSLLPSRELIEKVRRNSSSRIETADNKNKQLLKLATSIISLSKQIEDVNTDIASVQESTESNTAKTRISLEKQLYKQSLHFSEALKNSYQELSEGLDKVTQENNKGILKTDERVDKLVENLRKQITQSKDSLSTRLDKVNAKLRGNKVKLAEDRDLIKDLQSLTSRSVIDLDLLKDQINLVTTLIPKKVILKAGDNVEILRKETKDGILYQISAKASIHAAVLKTGTNTDLSEYITQAVSDTRYLKLDASNDPITGDLTINANLLFDGSRKIIGGSGVTDLLTLQGTSANGTSTAKAFRVLVGNNGGTEAMTILNDGNIGLGQTSPTGNKLYVVGRTRFERTISIDQQTVIDISCSISGTSLTGYGLSGNAYNVGTTTANVIGTQFNAVHQSSSTAGNIIGHLARAQIVGASTGNVTAMIGVQADCYLQGSGNATSATAVYINGVVKTSTGTATTAYGLRVASITSGGSGNYAIYTNTGLNRFGDQVSVELSTDIIANRLRGSSGQTLPLLECQTNTGTPVALITALGGAVFNESGTDADVRIEGDTDINNFFSDASTDRIGIGKNNPAYKLDVTGEINSTAGYRINGTAGASGTFTTVDGKTVTVTNGIITQIL